MTTLPAQLRGYTLLELVLVLAIIATTIAAAAPVLSKFARGQRAEEAARQFVALTRYARSQAVADGATYQLAIDTNAGKWQLKVLEDESTETYGEASGPFAKQYSVPEGIEIQAELTAKDGQQAITFDSTGRCDTGTVRFSGHGSEITVKCETPTETYRVVKDAGGRS